MPGQVYGEYTRHVLVAELVAKARGEEVDMMESLQVRGGDHG